MAWRTTEAEVRAIIESDSTIGLAPFIDVANDLVTELCTDSDYTETKLNLIETWLSAHFYAVRDLRSANEGVGGVSISYQYQVDLNLAVTVYGQQAMLIDTAGSLAALNKRTKEGTVSVISVDWLGEDYYENDDEE